MHLICINNTKDVGAVFFTPASTFDFEKNDYMEFIERTDKNITNRIRVPRDSCRFLGYD